MRSKNAISIFCKGILCFAFFFFSNPSFAQLNITPLNTATTLAQTIAGGGVSVSNATINCGGNASGIFSYSGSNLGLTGGIILSTGDASNAANPGNYLCNVNNGNNFSDPDLTAIVASANLDVCILEFDFVPTCNSVNMTYVFGSEEYPQGVGHFNDAFGIFLTGPNPSGGSYASQNIATLPNTTPVSINNVNASANSGYFHNNYSAPNNDVAYNGYTIPVTSVTSVVPCSTYKMKIAIADGGNALYDSGVLISNNSVSCQNPAIITATSTPSGGCQNTGSATVSVTNYTGTATYHWMPGGQTAATINNLGVGTYTCIVSLHQTCGIITQTVTASVGSVGTNLVLTSTQQNLLCNGASNGSATVSTIGGTAPFNCIWNTSPVQTGFTASNLSAGTYSATVTDNVGCQSVIQIQITAPPAMTLIFTTVPATCTGATGSTSVTVTANGTAPYSYSWNTTPIQNTQSISNLAQGIYTVTVTGSNSCAVTRTVSVGTQSPNWSLAIATPTNVNCFGGNNGATAVTINNPGNSTFLYSWNTVPAQNSPSISNLSAGSYNCTVSDNNGCVKSTVATISQPALLTANVSSVPTICAGSVGSVNVSAVGGTAPYSYLWSNSQNTNSITGLAQGQYSVTITDAHNCTSSSMVFVGTTNAVLQINTAVINSVCGGPSGNISITSVTNGTAPYSFSWATGQTSQNISNLSPGIYVVTATDKNGCTGSISATVNTTTVLPAQTTSLPDYCNQNSGSATVVANGNPPYNYLWSTSVPQTTQTASNLSAGNYTVLVSDAFNCKDTLKVTIVNQTDVFTPLFTTQPGGDLYSQDPVTLHVSTNGGWTFDNGNISDGTIISGLNFNHIFDQQGDYYVSYYFTSVHGCKDSVTYQIHIKDEMTLYIPNAFTPNNDGDNDEFKAEGTLIQSFEMYIYDSWGNLIIKLDDITQSWNGKYKTQNAPTGTYVYKGQATNAAGEQTDFKGQINLIR